MAQPVAASWNQTWRDLASPELSTALEQAGTPRRVGPGQLIYARGTPGHELYGIRSGTVRMVQLTEEGDEALVGLYPTGTWFGEISLFDEQPRPVSAYANGAVELLVVSSRDLRRLLDANPLWYRDFARVLCNKLRAALGHIESGMLPISVRIALRLLDLAEAYGRRRGEGVIIDLALSQADLARMLLLTRQSVNKELKTMEANGWLGLNRGQIIIRDQAALRSHVENGGGALLLRPVSAS